MRFKAPNPTPKGLWRRTPPAIFPSIMGLLGLGLAWRRGADTFGVPAGLAELFLGGVTLLLLFALLAFAVKVTRRPAVLAEDLRILPGRAGVVALALCIYLLAMVLAPYSPQQARPVLFLGLLVHAAVVAVMLYVFATGPAEQRRVSPVWHLTFVGFIIGALAAAILNLPDLARGVLYATLAAAAGIWGASAAQFVRASVPAPLRPLMAIHLSPAALFGLVALGLGMQDFAQVWAWASAGILAGLVIGGRWVTASGFSPLWGAFTFPLAATASLWISLGGMWRIPGGLTLVAATLIIPPIAFKVIQLWAKGQLAIKTNAAAA